MGSASTRGSPAQSNLKEFFQRESLDIWCRGSVYAVPSHLVYESPSTEMATKIFVASAPTPPPRRSIATPVIANLGVSRLRREDSLSMTRALYFPSYLVSIALTREH